MSEDGGRWMVMVMTRRFFFWLLTSFVLFPWSRRRPDLPHPEGTYVKLGPWFSAPTPNGPWFPGKLYFSPDGNYCSSENLWGRGWASEIVDVNTETQVITINTS